MISLLLRRSLRLRRCCAHCIVASTNEGRHVGAGASFICRFLSTQSKSQNDNDKNSHKKTALKNENDDNKSKKNDDPKITWLYKRTNVDGDDYMKTPRAVLGLATFHSLYWTWYVLDFLPAVNASPMEELHVDPIIGYVGMLVALLANLGAALYPTSLVSGVGLQEPVQAQTATDQQLQPVNQLHVLPKVCVFTHSLPTMAASKKGLLYDIGDVRMDVSTEETKRLVDVVFETKAKRSAAAETRMVGLKADGRRLPYLLVVNYDENQAAVDDATTLLLFQVLVHPEIAKQELTWTKRKQQQHQRTQTTKQRSKNKARRQLGQRASRGRRS